MAELPSTSQVLVFPDRPAALAAVLPGLPAVVFVSSDESRAGAPRMYLWTGAALYDVTGGALKAVPVPPPDAPPVVPAVPDAPVWQDTAQTQRVIVNITNDSALALSDHLITITLPAGFAPTAADLRVLEYGARGSIDRGNERRYAGIDVNRFAFGLPARVENGAVTFKEPGRHEIGETRTFALMPGNSAAVAQDYAHLNLIATTATEYVLGRTGPDTEYAPLSGITLPLAGTTYGQGRAVFGVHATILRLITYNVQGAPGACGLIAGTATVTQRNCELGVTGTLTGQVRAGQTLPDWTGVYTGRYQNRLAGSSKNDSSGAAVKGYDILRISLVLTCGVSYAPANGAVMKLLELYNGQNNTINGAIGMFQRPDGGALSAAPAGTAVPFAANVTAGIVGGTGNANSSALRVAQLSLVNWGAARPASFGWTAFGAQAVGIATSALSSANPVPVGAEIRLDFDLVINASNVVQANALAGELAGILDSLGVAL